MINMQTNEFANNRILVESEEISKKYDNVILMLS